MPQLPSSMEVGSKVLSAVRWWVTARIAGQLLSWGMTIAVVRILSPGDYGLMAMATVLPSALYLVNDLGLDIVLVQDQHQHPAFRQQVFGLVIVLNTGCALAMVLTAPFIAAFFREPRLTAVAWVLSFQFVLFAFDTLPRARLERDLEFKGQSLLRLAVSLAGGLTALVLALAGLGVWALVWGRLAAAVATTIGLNVLGWCLCWPSFSWQGARRPLSFGALVTADRISWTVFSEADKVVGGRFFGEGILGFYTVAHDLAALPMAKTAELVSAVGVSAFSQLQTNLAQVRAYLLKAVRITSLLTFPFFFGLATTAPVVVDLVLGAKWKPVTPLLQALALAMPLRMVSTLLPPVLWGIGRPGVSAVNLAIGAAVMPTALLVGAHVFGILGLALAWPLAYPLVFLIWVHRTGQATHLTVRSLLGAMMWPALASVLMCAVLVSARVFALGDAGRGLDLLLLGLTGAVVYLGVLTAANQRGVREALALFSRSRRRPIERS